jgi:hypothetical protein
VGNLPGGKSLKALDRSPKQTRSSRQLAGNVRSTRISH